MLDTLRLNRRLKELRKRLLELETKFKPLSEEKLVIDETLYNAAEHHLQIAIQCCLDMANHLVAALGLPAPEKEASEVFSTLAREKIIPQSLVLIMKKVTGYRNIVIHDYLEVERHRTYKYIQEDLPDLANFAKAVEKFLEEFSPKKTSRG